ncbi:hypothetical protein Lesp02_09830 [Lentzea sp. NBRC 105346]|uniref:DUF4360 domain-containing protein n=1 Tax=Lentzea sp. NBRC 105346 TaxID=3032205 RepID=UPI0024A3578C|nr:DUF4360 domain-containing protein [Lentzea sp. NBRC 105346]GLZ28793.1 hypothetical protein Lesp02_09830 [Lentzea sp. NBRC 105346]
MRIATASAGLALLLLASSAPAYASSIPSERVTVDVVTVNGSGCKPGTASVYVSPDNTWFKVTYRDYYVVAGNEAPPTDFRKNCQIVLRVNTPQGFSYGISRADYKGFLYIPEKASALQRANYYFQGSPANNIRDHRFSGPYGDYWHTTDETEFAKIVYSPCGEQRNLNINTELRVTRGDEGSTSFMTMDSSRGEEETLYHFSWKSCE